MDPATQTELDDADLAVTEPSDEDALLPPPEDDDADEDAQDLAMDALGEQLERLSQGDERWDFVYLPAETGPGIFLLFPDGPDTELLAGLLSSGARVILGQARYSPALQLQLTVEADAVPGLAEGLRAAFGDRLYDFSSVAVLAAPPDEEDAADAAN